MKKTLLLILVLLTMTWSACGMSGHEVKRTEDKYMAEKILPEDFAFAMCASWKQDNDICMFGVRLDDSRPRHPLIWNYDLETGELEKTALQCGDDITLGAFNSGYVDEDQNIHTMFYSVDLEKHQSTGFYEYIHNSEGDIVKVIDFTDEILNFFAGALFAYPQNLIFLPDETKLFTYTSEPLIDSIVLMAESGSVLFETKLDGYVMDVQARDDGRILVLERNIAKSFVKLVEIDQKTGKKKNIIKNMGDSSTCKFAIGNDANKIYYVTDEGLWECDWEGRRSCEIFSLSDLFLNNAADFSAVVQLEDGTWRGLADTGKATGEALFSYYNIYEISKSEGAENARTEMTLAVVGDDYSLTQAYKECAARYNRSQDEVSIVIKSYESADSLAKEITAGNIPDLVDVSDAFIRTSLEEKDLLADLNEYFSKDTQLAKTDFLENALQIYEDNGKLYAIPNSVSIMALIGNADYLKDMEFWDFEEFKNFMYALPDQEFATKYLVRNDFMQYACPLYVTHFVDAAEGTCDFQTKEFFEFLEFIKMFSEVEYGQYDFDDFFEGGRNGRFTVTIAGITNMQTYELLMAMFSNNGKMIGFPSDDGNGIYIMPGGTALAMTSACSHKDGAWEFLKSVMAREEHAFGKIPTYLPSYKAMMNEAREEAGDNEPSMQIDLGDITLDVPHASLDDIALVEKLLQNGRAVNGGDATIVQIIIEEAQSYFSGQKTVEQVAELIQNRVQLYLAE